MGSKMRSGTVALALAVVVAVTGACGADNDEAPGTAGGLNEAGSERSGRGGSGHAGGHDDRPKDNDNHKDKDKDGSGTTQVIEVKVAGGEVNGVGSTVVVPVGERVAMEVASDIVDEVHVHGYDVLSPVSPSKTAQLSFVADLPGAWEVELENAGLLLFELRVQ